MIEIVKVYNVDNKISENLLDDERKNNILNLFDSLIVDESLFTNCYLDINSSKYEQSPIYIFSECEDKEKFDYSIIANALLQSELKADGTRNVTIKEGLLFIKANKKSISIMKLDILSVIDKETYEIRTELGRGKGYFKICIFEGDYENIKIIDKNKEAAKYWYDTFLGLTRVKSDDDNTNNVIELIRNDSIYKKEIVDKSNYNEIKIFTEDYLFSSSEFDKSELFNKLNVNGFIELKNECELFSNQANNIDSDFKISKKVLKKEYGKEIKVSNNITIKTVNHLQSIRSKLMEFDEKNKKITLWVDDKFLNKIKEDFKIE